MCPVRHKMTFSIQFLATSFFAELYHIYVLTCMVRFGSINVGKEIYVSISFLRVKFCALYHSRDVLVFLAALYVFSLAALDSTAFSFFK